jgi:hypothetical protein
MPQGINITDEDILFAERILLPEGKTFDVERKSFIRNFKTLDLQAVPGSGKTTALLAKLIILEQKLPLQDGSGVLILSHTNVAVDEIRLKIQKYCPKLFSYPNFIGTIQSFVDQFLAIPFYVTKFKMKPIRIDNEIYDESVDKYLKLNFKGFSKQEQKNAKYFLMGNKCQYSFRFAFEENGKKLVNSINGDELQITKPKRGKSWVDFTIEEKRRIKEWLFRFKSAIMRRESVLHYDDAYFLADVYLNDIPQIKNILQKRFSYVFIDEMQDMDIHQCSLIEKVFYNEGNSTSVIQRIGDKNQAIYNSHSIKTIEVWNDRQNVLRLNGSQRLSKPIANVVKKFALYTDENFDIIGLNECTIKPHLLVFDNDSITEVIPRFAKIFNRFKSDGSIISNSSKDAKVICWNTEWKEQSDIEDISKLRLTDYYSNFKKEKSKTKQDYVSLKDYLLYYDKNKKTLESVRKNILSALLRILRLENINYIDGKPYTKKKLIEFFQIENEIFYEQFILNIYNWSIKIIQEKIEDVLNEIKIFLPIFFGIFSDNSLAISLQFINYNIPSNSKEVPEENNLLNQYIAEDLEIEITSVHAVKGQTHCATLYLESFYNRGYGNYESERLRNQFLGTQSVSETLASITTSKDKVIQSAKMAYVGFSRPTNLLCIAVHKSRFKSVLSTINKEEWEIVTIEPK